MSLIPSSPSWKQMFQIVPGIKASTALRFPTYRNLIAGHKCLITNQTFSINNSTRMQIYYKKVWPSEIIQYITYAESMDDTFLDTTDLNYLWVDKNLLGYWNQQWHAITCPKLDYTYRSDSRVYNEWTLSPREPVANSSRARCDHFVKFPRWSCLILLYVELFFHSAFYQTFNFY